MPLFNFLEENPVAKTSGPFAPSPLVNMGATNPAPEMGGGGSFLGDLLRATVPGQAMREVREKRALKELAARMQRGEMPKDEAAIVYAGITGDYSGLFGIGARSPAVLQEWQKFSAMSPEQQRSFLNMKRAGKVVDLGGSQAVLDPTDSSIEKEYEKALRPEDEPENVAAKAEAQVAGTKQGEREADLGKVQESASYMLSVIDKLLEPGGSGLAPGVKETVGGIAGLQGAQSYYMPITKNQRHFQPIINQIRGQTFMRAYETLKGGGQITEIEGRKGEQAIARLSQAQDEASFEEALRELRDVVKKGLDRAVVEADSGLIKQPTADQKMQGWDRETIDFGDLQ